MRRILQITVLIVAGEMVFSLPFHTARFFRSTFLDVFSFSNTDLGDIAAIYGITAMLSYFPGGVVADRYSARALLCVSLLLTAAGGIYMATIPGAAQMALLYGYWGVTTIFLFWAAMIRAVREWGGDLSQGKAFGILEGGRGLIAATVAMLAVYLFASYMPDIAEQASDAERREAFSAVILLYSGVTAVVGLLTWSLLPGSDVAATGELRQRSLVDACSVLRRPVVWAQAGIIICAYCGYKGGENLTVYADQVLGMAESDAHRLSVYANYTRPVAAVAAGILADRYIASRVLGVTFAVLVISYFVFFLATPVAAWMNVIYVNIFVSFFAVFSLRGVYFALVQETRTPPNITGTTVGVVSFVGFTPEIFFAPITGRILDAFPGVQGHQYYYLFLSAVSLVGLVMVTFLVHEKRRVMRTTGV